MKEHLESLKCLRQSMAPKHGYRNDHLFSRGPPPVSASGWQRQLQSKRRTEISALPPPKKWKIGAETTPEEGTTASTEIVSAETAKLCLENITCDAYFARILPFCDSQPVNGIGDSSSGYRVSKTQPTLSWETPALQKQLGEDHTRSMGVGSHTGLQSTLQSAALSDIPTKSFNSPSSRGSSHAAGDWEYARKAYNRRNHTQWARFPVNNLPGSQER